ncbi:MAG: ATP-dependent DNA helicase RecG [Myxococcales bacterium]|jgi:ATP-dependent DNA helicase RecG
MAAAGPELTEGLRACLSATPPDTAGRAAIAQGLRTVAADAGDGGLTDALQEAAEAMACSEDRRALSVAAARAMRLLSVVAERASAAEGAGDEGEDAGPAPSISQRRRARRQARREHGQQRDLQAHRRGELSVEAQPVETLPRIGRATGLSLRARGLHTVGHLAWLLPLGYHDERSVTPIAELRDGERQVTQGRVVSARYGGRVRGRRMAEVLIEGDDGSGQRLRLSWFHAPGGLLERFPDGARFRVAGTVQHFRGMPSMTHPQTARLDGPNAATPGIVPRYAAVPGVAPKVLAAAVTAALERIAPAVQDAIPEWQRAQHDLGPVRDALRALHHPPRDLDDEALLRWNAMATEHHERLAFEEFYLLELALHRRRVDEQGVAAEPLPPGGASLQRAEQALGFELTAAQRRVIAEIGDDLGQERPMRRLLQGDVGSGKTAVALLAAARAVAGGGQVAFMAPTEVLAEQHFGSLAPVAEAMGLRAELVLGGARASHRRKTRKALAEGRVDLAVGTHALLSEGVEFARLRLVIVDEQHRFGVGQRLRLVDKGGSGVAPHLLVMTATPIPRTLALALHGDLSASVLDEMPPGRVPPVTRAYDAGARERALRQLERGLRSDGQAYVICPSIEPNEETGVRSVLEAHEELSPRLERWGVELLHGQLPAEQKQRAMERFKSGEARVLVATTIVEVGVDVPAANVILIENAERFGLAQLHQLRGRVGRAGQRSACLLVHEARGEDSRERMRVLCESHDGFRIAEEDLKLRGPGELFGRRQSGLPGFRFGDLRRDAPLLARARDLAAELIERDPELRDPDHACTAAALETIARSERALVKEEAG